MNMRVNQVTKEIYNLFTKDVVSWYNALNLHHSSQSLSIISPSWGLAGVTAGVDPIWGLESPYPHGWRGRRKRWRGPHEILDQWKRKIKNSFPLPSACLHLLLKLALKWKQRSWRSIKHMEIHSTAENSKCFPFWGFCVGRPGNHKRVIIKCQKYPSMHRDHNCNKNSHLPDKRLLS